jgi:hypothetical protein
MSARAKLSWTVLAALFVLLAAGRANAQCQTDVDCPNAACGGDVCTKSSGLSSCSAAGERGLPGSDGWCADANGNPDDSKCKCRGMGATCNGFYCTFTMPSDGGGAGGSSGSGGTGGASAGTAGTSGGSTGSSGGGGCNIGGVPSLGGAPGLGLLLAALLGRRARRG